MTKTFSLKAADIKKEWILIDAENIVVGRLAAMIATRLRGKHKPEFTPHLDCGDYVIIVNADKVAFTGKKLMNKTYYRHTGYPGGIRSQRAEEILKGKNPERLLLRAVKNMMPSGALSTNQIKNLHLYVDGEHPHQAQKPTIIDFSAQNKHNSVIASNE